MFDMILYKPPTNVSKRTLQNYLSKCKVTLTFSGTMLKIAKHTLKSMFGHFSTLCMKDLTEHCLDAAFIPIKSQCKMGEWQIRVKQVQFMLMECHDHLNHFQSFRTLLLPAPSRIPEIPKEKNSTVFSTVDHTTCFITAPMPIIWNIMLGRKILAT